MGSRYMLIEFDDEASADALRARIDTATRAGKRFRVVGMFAKPRAPYCQCGKETSGRGKPSTLKRGRKFGWWVCTECRRPSGTVASLVNLINPRDIIDPPIHKAAPGSPSPGFPLIHHIYTITPTTKGHGLD